VSQELIDGIELVHSHSIVVIDNHQDNTHYLNTLLNFLGCEVNFLTAPADLEVHLKQIGSRPILGIFLGSGFTAEQLQHVAKIAAAQTLKLPIFMVGTKDDLPDRPNGDVLGNLVLPCNLDSLINLVHKAHVFVASQANDIPAKHLDQFRSVAGRSKASKELDNMVHQVASSNATVLILGESGTGKEVIARKLHLHSNRRNKPFVPVNCGAIPEDLLESELFGHEKGAFTGAITARKGRFEMAEGGTLFLDEIGDMSMPMQVKILRVLQERTFERVGSNKTIECDVRILAATHRDLESRISDGLFREDLFYRLNVFPILMPPLRERTEDIPMLVHDLVRRLENENRGSVRLTPLAVSALTYYQWPGNVRELANLIERLAILFPHGVVDVNDLPEKFREGVPLQELKLSESQQDFDEEEEPSSMPVSHHSGALRSTMLPADGMDLKNHLADIEKNLIQQALDEADGVVAQAAQKLQMRRTTLVEKLKKYDLQRDKDSTLI